MALACLSVPATERIPAGACPGGRFFHKMTRSATGGAAVAKKNKKEKKTRTPARFGKGAQVRVKPGTTVPDFEDIPLGGWAGAIRDVDQRSNPPTYLIEWDRHTLDHMH